MCVCEAEHATLVEEDVSEINPGSVFFPRFVDPPACGAVCFSVLWGTPPPSSYCTSLCAQSKCSFLFGVFSHLPAVNPPPLSLRYLNERRFAAFVPATCVSLVLFAHKQKPKPSLVALHWVAHEFMKQIKAKAPLATPLCLSACDMFCCARVCLAALLHILARMKLPFVGWIHLRMNAHG